jgi:hypothetical protein
LAAEEFIEHVSHVKAQKPSTSLGTGKWTYGRKLKTECTLKSFTDIEITMYNMQKLDTWLLWTKDHIWNFLTAHGSTDSNPTGEAGTTPKNDV